MVIKPIKLHHLCIMLTFLICFVISNLVNSQITHNSEKAHEAEARGVLSDLPSKYDLNEYVQHLERIINFVDGDKSYIDVAFAFNLFLVNINLKAILTMKYSNIDEEVSYTLAQILQKNDKFIEYFLQSEKDSKHLNYIGVPELFYNETIWIKHLRMYTTRLLKETTFYSPKELNSMFPAFDDYVEKVSKLKHFLIDPKLLNKCMWQLLNIPANNDTKLAQCDIDTACEAAVLQGSDYGHEILHRLLYFIIARHARGCVVTSAKLDKALMKAICVKIYNEAEFIAYNKFQLPHLSMAQISLCSLEGHVQFLRRSWISNLLQLTTGGGCLINRISSKAKEIGFTLISTIADKVGDIIGGVCSSYTTGTEAVMLASVIRYILETFY